MLPTISLAPLAASGQHPDARATAEALTAACHDPGFCYLTDHGVDARLEQRAQRVARDFFALPRAAREAIAISNSAHFRGYTLLGDEHTNGASDYREQLDVGVEGVAQAPRADEPPWQRLNGPNQWPSALPDMAPTVLEWMAAMQDVGLAVLRGLAVGLGQRANRFDDYVTSEAHPKTKIIRYPGRPATAPQTDPMQGVGLHHDSGLLTFILQDEASGLEVHAADGNVIPVPPRPGTLVLNLGEMMQALSADYLIATPHRVLVPPDGTERISLAFFYNPRLDAVLEPVELPAELAARARPAPERSTQDPIHASFGMNTLKIRLRAHPDVREKFYADVNL
ncbi:MAG: 2-oxoglutarate and iron-dependent oxygenase domain-containing protein [Pseudomonadota bacterium]